MRWRRGRGIAVIALQVAWFAACSAGYGGAAGPGQDGGPCYPNGTCDQGLACSNGVCSRTGSPSSTEAGGQETGVGSDATTTPPDDATTGQDTGADANPLCNPLAKNVTGSKVPCGLTTCDKPGSDCCPGDGSGACVVSGQQCPGTGGANGTKWECLIPEHCGVAQSCCVVTASLGPAPVCTNVTVVTGTFCASGCNVSALVACSPNASCGSGSCQKMAIGPPETPIAFAEISVCK